MWPRWTGSAPRSTHPCASKPSPATRSLWTSRRCWRSSCMHSGAVGECFLTGSSYTATALRTRPSRPLASQRLTPSTTSVASWASRQRSSSLLSRSATSPACSCGTPTVRAASSSTPMYRRGQPSMWCATATSGLSPTMHCRAQLGCQAITSSATSQTATPAQWRPCLRWRRLSSSPTTCAMATSSATAASPSHRPSTLLTLLQSVPHPSMSTTNRGSGANS
mmetsp:Transcript_83003/g.165714  ORF Transcript_83003/g.165714 Transcript_83003/m.165714 type:complete len:222 (-) Transcript_83003:446-1111(-)